MHFDILITEFLVFQGDCWICMELMATSLDKFYKFVYCSLDDVIPEEILGKITLAVSFFFFVTITSHFSKRRLHFRLLLLNLPCVLQTVKALNHLKENLKIIHRGKTTPDPPLILLHASVRLSHHPFVSTLPQTLSRQTSSWTGTAT